MQFTSDYFTGKNYVCSYCGTQFNGDECPSCCSTQFEKSKELIDWEKQQEQIAQNEKELEQRKIDSRASTTKTIAKIRLATVIIFVTVFLISWLSQFIYMSSIRSLF